MRFEWIDGLEPNDREIVEYEEKNGISRYKCYLLDDKDNILEEISFIDYSTKGEIEEAKKNKWIRPYAYEVRYCNHGYSMSKIFDEGIPSTKRNLSELYGFMGPKEHTVEDIKRWCENYIAEKYIINYEEEYQKLQKRKERSDWFISQGYGEKENKEEIDIELD